MKRINTKTALVALLALAVSTSALAAGPGKKEGREGRDAKEVRTQIGAKNETAGESKAKAENVALIGDITNGMKIEESPILKGFINGTDKTRMVEKTALAYEKGLLGERSTATRALDQFRSNPNKEEFQSLFAVIQLLSVTNSLSKESLTEKVTVDGKSVEINLMNYLMSEALMVAQSSSPKFIQANAKAADAIRTSKGKIGALEAYKQALKEVGISWDEFVRRCLVKA